MSFWVYKCNDTGHKDQVVHGDWEYVFHAKTPVGWGNTKDSPDLEDLSAGDLVIAFQSERNEVVGLAEVVRLKPVGKHKQPLLKALEHDGVELRPLKKIDERIRGMDAFKPGKIQTIYDITTSDAWHLIAVVKAQRQMDSLCAAK